MPVDTQYTIHNSRIYDNDNQDTGLFLERGEIHNRSGYTGYYINRVTETLYIYGPGGNTYYYLEGERIFGPDLNIPWIDRIRMTM